MSLLPGPADGSPVTVVMATHNRADEALASLDRLSALPERPPVVVVDNGSVDHTVEAVRTAFPAVEVVVLGSNRGAVARNVGVERASTPYVAFSDDDSWWAPGALSRAAAVLDAFPRLALIAARVLVGRAAVLDPTCRAMSESPLPAEPDLPGPPVLGFLACGTAVRRSAYLQVGGFHELLFVYGEEALLAMDLTQAGWGLSYVDEVVAHHHPSPVRDRRRRRCFEARNALLTAWLRRPLPVALRRTGQALRASAREGAERRALLEALQRLPAALAGRRVVAPGLERRIRLLEEARDTANAEA